MLVVTIREQKLLDNIYQLRKAVQEVLARLAPDQETGQCWLCSDALHPFRDDDTTIVDYLREVMMETLMEDK